VTTTGPARPENDTGDDAHAAQVTCTTITCESDFLELQGLWQELWAQTSAPSSFRSWDFALEWLNHFVKGNVAGATGRFEVVVAFDGSGRALGLLPLFEENITAKGAFFGSTLQPFGRSMSFESMTDEPIVLLRAGYEEIAARTLRAAIRRRSGLAGWDIAVVHEPPRVARPSLLPTAVAPDAVGAAEITRHRLGPMTLWLPASWEVFERRLSKSMRDNLSHYPRKLTRDLGQWTIRWARAPREVAAATEVLIALHHERSLSTTGPAHTSHIPTPVHARFLRHWFQRLAWCNRICIGTLELGGRTVAAQAFVEGPGCVSVYYSGYDEAFYRYSPLTIILAESIRSAIERDFARVDFPPGNKPWKSRWGAREEVGVDETSIYATTLPALFRGAARRIAWRLVR
jgi:CelD/BcsL family acetyltransferase involved in cellulose biosynthesis